MFGGFGEVLGVGAIGAGAIGAFKAARVGSRMADETNHKDPNSIINRGKHLLAGMAGGVTGVSAAAKAWSGAKDHPGSAVIQAYQNKMLQSILKVMLVQHYLVVSEQQVQDYLLVNQLLLEMKETFLILKLDKVLWMLLKSVLVEKW